MKVKVFLGIIMVLTALFCIADDEGSKSITIAELKDQIYFLASDYLNGRVAGSPEYKIAAEFCASQMQQMGLIPAFKDADGNPSYFQKFNLINRTIKNPLPFVLTSGGKQERLLFKEDYSIVYYGGLEPKAVNMAFAGYGISDESSGWDDLIDLDIEGRLVIVMYGAPEKDGKPVLDKENHEKFDSPRGMMYKRSNLIYKMPAAVAFIVPDDQYDSMLSQAIGYGKNQTIMEGDKKADSEARPMTMMLKESSFRKALNLTKLEIGEEINQEDFRAINEEFGKISIKFDYNFDEEKLETFNVGGILPGSDEKLKEEYIVISGHLDHVAGRTGEPMNGADDDASGCIGALEATEALTFDTPARSTIAVLFAAEEVGLYGSKYFVQNPPVPLKNMVLDIQLDMIGRSDPANSETRAHHIVGPDMSCDQLEEIIRKVNERTVNWPLIYNRSRGLYQHSDHYSFYQEGVPGFFMFSGMHKDLHRPTDDPDKIDYEKMQALTRLVYHLAKEIGNLPEKLCSGK